MNNNKGINFKVENDKFIMEIDFDTWKYATENIVDFPLAISSLDDMKNYVIRAIKNGIIQDMYKDTGSEEVGCTMWMDILDKIITDAYENGEEWLC